MTHKTRAALAAAFALTAGMAMAQDGAQDGEPLRTGLDATFAPHAMPTLDGGIEGFNVDLFNAVAERMGREIEIDATEFSGLLPALQSGNYDFIAAPTTVTPERAENLLFTEGYLNTDYQFVIPADAEEKDELEDFEGMTIAVNRGSAYDAWARDLADEIGWTIESYGTNTDAVQAVLSGRADANVAGNTVSAWAAKNNPRLKLSYLHSTGLVWAAPLRQDSVELRNEIEEVIECMKLDGTIAELHVEWFDTEPAEGSAAVTVFPGYGVPDTPGYEDTEHEPSCES